MSGDYWHEHYKQRAVNEDLIYQSGRGSQFSFVDILRILRQIAENLQLEPTHRFVDIGAGNGILDIPLSGLVKELTAVEPVAELVSIGKELTGSIENLTWMSGNATDLPLEDESADRILFWTVFQLLTPDTLEAVLQETARISAPGCRIMIGSLPEAERYPAYKERYLDTLDSVEHLSQQQRDEIRHRNAQAYWHSAKKIVDRWCEISGGKGEILPLPDSDPNHRDRVNVILTR